MKDISLLQHLSDELLETAEVIYYISLYLKTLDIGYKQRYVHARKSMNGIAEFLLEHPTSCCKCGCLS